MASSMPTATHPAPQKDAEREETQEMSAEELKAHLYHSLQAKGILDQLQSQLRYRLVRELKRNFGSSRSGAPPTSPLALQAANSITAEHLRVCGYEYSLSTFLPESHTSPERLFSRDDLLHYLKLDTSSPLHKALQEDSGRGFLRDLLESLSSVLGGGVSHTHSIGVQTDHGSGEHGTVSLTAKLRALDESYAARMGDVMRKHGEGVGVREEEWRREQEAQLRMQLEQETEQLRDAELSRVREEERARCEAELCQVRRDLEEKHQRKTEAVRKLELDTLERLRRKEGEMEAALHSRRQALQQQLQVVGVREEEVRRQAQLNQETYCLAEQRVAMAVQQIAAREKEIQRSVEQHETALEERAKRYRQQCELELETRRAELTRWEGQLKAEQQQQLALRADHQRVCAEVREERGRREGLQASAHEATRKMVELQQQTDALQRELGKMSDYGRLREQLADQSQRLAAAERRLSEAKAEHRRQQSEQQEVIKKLRSRMGRPNHEELRRMEEVEQVRRELQSRLKEVEEEKKQLRKQLSVHTHTSGQLHRQLEEQALQLREAQREVADLHTQLHRFQAAPHHRHVGKRYSKPLAGSPSKRTPLHQTSLHLSTRPDLSPHTSPSPPPPLLPHHPPSSSPSSSPLSTHVTTTADASSHLLSETRATFVRLEQEATELERYYQTFQQRLTDSCLPPDLSPPPSPEGHISLLPVTSSQAVPSLGHPRVALSTNALSHLSTAPYTVQTTVQGIMGLVVTAASDAPQAPPSQEDRHMVSLAMPSLRNVSAVPPPRTSVTPFSPPLHLPPHPLPPTSPALTSTMNQAVTYLTTTTRTTPSTTTDLRPVSIPRSDSIFLHSSHHTSGETVSPSMTTAVTAAMSATSSTCVPSLLLSSLPAMTPTTISLLERHSLTATATSSSSASAGQMTQPPNTTSSPSSSSSSSSPPSSTSSSSTTITTQVTPAATTTTTTTTSSPTPSSAQQPLPLPTTHPPHPTPTVKHTPPSSASLPPHEVNPQPPAPTFTAPSLPQTPPGPSVGETQPQPARISLDDLWKHPEPQTKAATVGGGGERVGLASASSLPLSGSAAAVSPPSTTTEGSHHQHLFSGARTSPPIPHVSVPGMMDHVAGHGGEEREGGGGVSGGGGCEGGGEEWEERVEEKGEAEKEEEEEEEEEDSVDPVMLKYMELVKQKRAEEREKQSPLTLAEDHSESRHSQDYGLPALSQTPDSIGGFSEEQGDDPFQEW